MTGLTLHLLGGQVAWQAEVGPNLLVFLLAVLTAFNTWQNRQIRKDGQTNGGSTSRDALDRIEQHAAATSAVVAPDADLPEAPTAPMTTPPCGVPVTP